MCRFSGAMKQGSRTSCDGGWDSGICARAHLTASYPAELSNGRNIPDELWERVRSSREMSAVTRDSIERYLVEHFGNEDDCPCCCHNSEEAECVREHGEGGCCLVSEYEELDRCCYSSNE